MKLGEIRTVKTEATDWVNGGTIPETYWEIWNGKRWIGKAFSSRVAERVSAEIKQGIKHEGMYA